MKRVDLGNICEIKSGRCFKQGIKENNDGVYVVQMSDVTGENNEINWSQVIKAEVSLRTHKSLKNGDILFLAKGKTNKALTVSNLTSEAVAANHFFVLSVGELVDPDFLTMQLNSPSVQQYLQQHASGDKKKHITKATLANLAVGLCDIGTQGELLAISKSIESDICKIKNDYEDLNNIFDMYCQSENKQTIDRLEQLMGRTDPSFFSSYMSLLHSIVNRENLNIGIKGTKSPRKLL